MNNNNTQNSSNELVFRSIVSMLDRYDGRHWTGTMTRLTHALNRVLSRKQRTMLPGSPSALRVSINKVVNRLRSKGIGVKFSRTPDHRRTRFVRFSQ